ncbi:MAG: L-2-amino-thiazoline-4-carboxylic acid hydrolase [Actinomycetota bacterium]|nr:L-2-amino-thiazoline-4-carboxylic acid hydrolase [Actinomycetota bacterium]
MTKRLRRYALVFAAGVGVGMLIKDRARGVKLDLGSLQRELMRRRLAARWGGEGAERILEALADHYGDLLEDGMREKGVMAFHLEVARRGLALYRALYDETGSAEEAVDTAHELMWEAFMKVPSRIMGTMIAAARDPFAGFAAGMRWTNTHVFPEPWWRRENIDMEDGVGMDYTGCFYYDYLRRKGAPELTRAFCEMDVKQASCFPPQIEFVRTQTLATGHDRCDFRYYRRG